VLVAGEPQDAPGPPNWQAIGMVKPQWIRVEETFRYPKPTRASEHDVDGYPNFYNRTKSSRSEEKLLQLESGINLVAHVKGLGSVRRPLLLIRSSPWKAGTEGTPWHDQFDLAKRTVRYYGDHKVTTSGPVGSTPGNGALLEAWSLHRSNRKDERALAPPLAIFRSAPTKNVNGRMQQKGYVEFCGIAFIRTLSHVTQRAPDSQREYPNIVLDLALIPLAKTGERVNWQWIDDRRNGALTATESNHHAPAAWEQWVETGRCA
jgi:Restriction endonuclease AspBHI N-terminal